MGLHNRETLLAVVPEVTEGVPVAPSAATQFTAIQEDLEFNPVMEELENAELKASIGISKTIRGLENPTAQFSHYLRHSGVEGQAPDFNDVLKALFGSEVVASTEYDTVVGSSVSSINVDTGEGVNFQRGQMLLIKDPVNGFAIRPVQSVSSDALALGFNLANAPGTGVNTGKCVLYKPADVGHQTLSLWRYLANLGAVELISGCRPTQMSIDFQAGELINSQFQFAGLKAHFNPITLAATDTKLDFLDNATTRVVTLAAKTYRDPHELASEIQTKMNALGSGNTFTVTYSDTTGKFTLTSSGTTFTLKFATGANTANTIANAIGFDPGSDESAALTYTSDTAQSFTASYSPTFDDADPLVAKDGEILIGDATNTVCPEVSSVNFTFGAERAVQKDICSPTGQKGSIVTKREVTIDVVATLEQFDVSKFKRFREGSETRFFFAFGVKSGNNWVPGKCAGIYIPTAVVSEFKTAVDNGLLVLNFSLKAFVNSTGQGEIYLGFV